MSDSTASVASIVFSVMGAEAVTGAMSNISHGSAELGGKLAVLGGVALSLDTAMEGLKGALDTGKEMTVLQARTGAMAAMASIPYVGPILAVAAMATMLGVGFGLVKGISKGFASGGYTEDGDASKPSGVVHAGEWVAPKWMVNDPRFRSTIDSLESQRTGASGSAVAMAERYSEANQGQPGFQVGGFFHNLFTGQNPGWMKWFMPGVAPAVNKLLAKYNITDGTAFYGNPNATSSFDTRTPAQIEAERNYAGGLVPAMPNVSAQSMDITKAMTSAIGSGTGSGGASAGSVGQQQAGLDSMNVAMFGKRQDAEQWLRTKRGRRTMIDFINANKFELA